jgi:hypothetical protein
MSRTWGAAVLRPYVIVTKVKGWVMLDLNPAIWEAIAATGWRVTNSVVVGIWVGLNLNAHPLKPEGWAPNCLFFLGGF